MRELWQVDILRYMVYCLEIPQNIISCGIADLLPGISNDPTKINKLLSGTVKKGYEGLQPEHIYDKLIDPQLKHRRLKQDYALSELKKFLQGQNIAFSEPEGLAKNDYRGYMLAVLEEGLPKFRQPKNISNTKQSKTRNPDQTLFLKSPDPMLHTQNFTSITSFTGREDMLEKMDKLLQTKQTVVLSGLGGIGKTSLANKYAQLNTRKYLQKQRIVCGNTVHSFRQMILALNFDRLDETGIEEDAKYQERMKLLKKMDSSTLLIIDNVDEWPDDFNVFDELRTDSQIHIIITTRLRDKFDISYTIPVDVLAVSDQLKLFEYHLNCKVENKFQATVTEILKCVDGHTLLIELIAKSIYSGSLDYSEMLEFLQSGETSTELSDIPIHIQKDDYNRQDRMWQFVQKILFNIEPLPQEQQCTLRHLVLLPMDGISRKLFLRKLSPQTTDALTQLENRSWSIREYADSYDVIRLHPVIRETAKNELSPTCDNCRVFLKKLEQMLPTDNASDFSEDLCKLIRSIIHTLDQDFMNPPYAENMNFLVAAAEFYRKWKEYDYYGALDIYRPALRILQGCDSSSCLDSTAVNLYIEAGLCYQKLADYDKAIQLYNSAAYTATEGSYQRAEAYRNLGEVYRKKSDYSEALKFDQLALEGFTEDSDIAKVKNAMGVVYINMGNYVKAKEYYLEARERWEACVAVQPSDNLYKDLAYVNHNIGTVYYQLGQFLDAEKQHFKALNIRMEHKFPEYQRDVAASHAWLANDYLRLEEECQEKGELQQAEDYMKKAKEHIDESLSIRKELLGEKHPDYAWSLITLSEWYEVNENITNALLTMQQVVQIRRSILSDDHKYTKDAIERYETLQLKSQKKP